MSKMAELHYKQSKSWQEDDPSIEYNMTHYYIGKWTPNIYNWFEKNYNQGIENPVYIRAEKGECPF